MRWTLALTGEEQLGGSFTLEVQGPPGTALWLAGLPAQADLLLPSYGWMMLDIDTYLVLFALPVGTPVPLALPDDPTLHGVEFGVQAVVDPAASPQLFQFTNVFRGRLHLQLVVGSSRQSSWQPVVVAAPVAAGVSVRGKRHPHRRARSRGAP